MTEDCFNQKIVSQLNRFIAGRVKEKEDREEILQETLISAFQSLPNFSHRSSFSVWLCGIAKHEIGDFYRKKKIKTILFSHLPFLEKLADQALGPEEILMEKELKSKAKRILGKVTEGYRVVLRLKYIEGNSVSQIAQRLAISAKAVESRLSRARTAFKVAWAVENGKTPKRIIKDFYF